VTDDGVAFMLSVPIDEERTGAGESLRERKYTLILVATDGDAEEILRAFGRLP
jgi:hypothetical protein